MKRVLPVILVLTMVFPALLLPAAAAEPQRYVFEYFEMPVAYADYPFSPDADLQCYVYDGLLPEGMYTVSVELSFEAESFGINCVVPGVFTVKYDHFTPDIEDGYCELVMSITLTSPGDSIISEPATVFLIPASPDTLFFVEGLSLGDMSFFQKIVFESYDFGNELTSFLGFLATGLVDLSAGNIVQVILVALSVVAAPVLCWFGYRFVKHKLLKSFMKGKI